jgi:hypothetical protein
VHPIRTVLCLKKESSQLSLTMVITLPPQINATGLLPFLSSLTAQRAAGDVTIDFTFLRRVSPAALAALACAVDGWQKSGRTVFFDGLDRCVITGYLQRMDILQVCGVELPEQFKRHVAEGRFVPVQRVDAPVDAMGTAMAQCVAPGGDDYEHPLSALYDFVWYVLTETANNVRQHSGGTGFATAQVTQTEGFVRLAVADNGRGIRQSFLDAGLPWAAALDDVGSIRKALEPLVSSKGNPTNEGVGLTLSAGLARLAKAWLLIVSGYGLVRLRPDGVQEHGRLPGEGFYPGTLVGLTFKQSDIGDFAELLTAAKVGAGLLQRPGLRGNFIA